MFSMAMWMLALVAPMQIFAGDQHGLNTLEHQPAKIAAMEGHFETAGRRAADPVRLARHGGRARPATRSRSRSSAASSSPIPGTARCQGLKAMAARRNGPMRTIIFWTFRIMVGIGLLMLGARPVEPVAALARHALRASASFTALCGADGADGLRRGARRLGHDRSRPPALHGLWPAAHRRFRLADRGTERSPLRSPPSSSSTSSCSAPASSTCCASMARAADACTSLTFPPRGRSGRRASCRRRRLNRSTS